jgi:hypothetical protein
MDFNRLQLTGSQLSLKTKAGHMARLFRLARFPASAFWVASHFPTRCGGIATLNVPWVTMDVVTDYVTSGGF